jgi:hypothetical protein
MGGDWGLGFLSKNDDITSFQGSLKVLICWRYQYFLMGTFIAVL